MTPMNKIGIYINRNKAKSMEVAQTCIRYLSGRGVETFMLSHQLANSTLTDTQACSEEAFYTMTDGIITLGGDGTILGVARNAAMAQVPICGINLGKLGFLTEGEADDLEMILDELCEGNYLIEERLMLKCTVFSEDGSKRCITGLNDVLVRSTGMRMIELTAAINDDIVDVFRADGIVISTPTGSTGYSLSAGGPVVMPGTEVFLLNPICPHRMHDRAYVVPKNAMIKLTFPTIEKDIVVYVDGQIAVPVTGNDRICIEKSDDSARLIRPEGFSFFKRLRQKFNCDI